MRRHRLQRTQQLPVSMEQAWRFFASPLNLPLITPAWLRLTPLGEVPDRMFAGMIIHYRVTPLFGFALRWISEITHVDPPRCFVDEQRRGPYRFWHHHHHFRPAVGGIEMTDTVTYALKYGLVGTLIHALTIRKRLEEIFDFRQRCLQRYFGTRSVVAATGRRN